MLPEQILPVLLQEETPPPALLPEQTLVIPVDGMDQTKFRMPSPKWFKGKPAKEVRDAEEKEFKKWVAEGAERPSLVDTWNLMKLPVDNTSACSKNMGLRYAASSGLALAAAPRVAARTDLGVPAPSRVLPEPDKFEELPRPEPSLSLEVSASQMGDYPDFDSQVEEVE